MQLGKHNIEAIPTGHIHQVEYCRKCTPPSGTPAFDDTYNGKCTREDKTYDFVAGYVPGITFFNMLATVPSENARISNCDMKTN